MADVNVYTASRLGEMARSLEILARSCQDEMDRKRGLSREDAMAAMQMSAAMVCEDCSRCNLYSDSEKEDSYYLYYLLRAFEQKGQVEFEDMPRFFLEICRRREEYLAQLNRHLGRATMNLEWKNRFLESRDTVMIQFRELAVILEEFAHQMEQASDITESREEAVKRAFRQYHMLVENLLILEHEDRKREAYLTVRTTNGRCVTAREAAELLGQAMGNRGWYAPKDTRALVTRQTATIHFAETGRYRMMYGLARVPREGETFSGDNFTYSEEAPGQVIMSISDGMGSGEQAFEESRRVVELAQQLLETGFSARSALKMVNTVLILEAGEVPAGVLKTVEPVLLSRKLWDGDRVILVTDGVLEACPGEDKEGSLREYIEGMEVHSVQEMADELLEFACREEEPRDDMLVMVGGIWRR